VRWGGINNVNGSLTHTSLRHAMLLYVLFDFHACIMLTLLYGSSSEEFHVRRSQAVSRRFEHCWYPNVEPALEVFEFLASSHGFEMQRAWTFHFAPLRDTMCVRVVLAIKLTESRSGRT